MWHVPVANAKGALCKVYKLKLKTFSLPNREEKQIYKLHFHSFWSQSLGFVFSESSRISSDGLTWNVYLNSVAGGANEKDIWSTFVKDISPLKLWLRSNFSMKVKPKKKKTFTGQMTLLCKSYSAKLMFPIVIDNNLCHSIHSSSLHVSWIVEILGLQFPRFV